MADTTTQIKHAQPEPASLIGRDEMNLAEFPVALLADRVPKGQKTLYFEDQHGRLTVTGSDAYGLPTAADTDVIVALIYLTKIRNEFSDVKVNFSRYELIKLLNWQDEGGSYKRLDQSFNRWSGVLLVYDKCWWNNKLKCYTDAKMHIIDSVEIIDNDARRRAIGDGQHGLPLSYFTWNRKFIESCQADNLRQIDLDIYFTLRSAVSKRLYRFLGKRFYVQRDWTFDLNEIAFDRVGLSRSYEHNAGKIKEKLQPAIDELEAIGFLRPLSREGRYSRIDRGQWTIRLTRQSAPVVAVTRPEPQAAEPETPSTIAELVKRGVTKATAAELAQRHSAEVIRARIEVFDWIMEQTDRPKRPVGYLVKSIEKEYAAPDGFIGKADRQQRAEAKAAKDREAADERSRMQRVDAQAREERAMISGYWNGLSKEQQAEHDAAAIAQADAEELKLIEPGPMRRIGLTLLRDSYTRKLLQAQGKLPAAEE